MAEFSESDARLLRELLAKKQNADNAGNKGPTCKFHLANGDKIEVPFPKAREILMRKYGWAADDFGDEHAAPESDDYGVFHNGQLGGGQ